MLEKAVTTQCRPQSSLPKLYDFKRNMSAAEMYVVLGKHDYLVHLQAHELPIQDCGVGGCAGENRYNPGNPVFVPCAPSTLLDDVDLILVDQVQEWKDYQTTVQELNQLYVTTEGKINVFRKRKLSTTIRLWEVLTETEQYVKISPAMENVADELEEMESMDYLEADKVIVGSVAPNNKRVRTIRNIHMESRFYRIFRTTVRELLGQYENRFYKLQIVDMLENLAYS
jgi:hypothetical protein